MRPVSFKKIIHQSGHRHKISSRNSKDNFQGYNSKFCFENCQVTVSESKSSGLEFKCTSVYQLVCIYLDICMYIYMHGCDSWCFQSSYHLLPSFVGPLICHTNFSPSPRDTSEVFHVEAGKGSIFTSKTFGPCQGKLCPQRWSWLDLKVNFCSSFFVERWTCLPKKRVPILFV